MKISRGVLQLKLCQTAYKSRPHDLFTHFDRHFGICAGANIVPLNLTRNDFMSHACSMQFVKEFILINYNYCTCKKFWSTAIVYFLGIFFFILVSLVRFCHAVGDSPIYLQVSPIVKVKISPFLLVAKIESFECADLRPCQIKPQLCLVILKLNETQ